MAARDKYSLDERVFLVKHYFKLDADYSAIFEAFKAKFPKSTVPTRQYVLKLIKQFLETGSVVDAARSG